MPNRRKPPTSRNACSSGLVSSAEYAVAVRKMPETLDDVPVPQGMLQNLLAERNVALDGDLLVGEAFRMREWQIEE